MTTADLPVDPRVVRWMSRRGQGLRLSAAAALLLAPRLRARWRAGAVALVLLVALLVGWCWFGLEAPPRADAGSAPTFLRMAAPYAVIALGVAVLALVGRRHDRALATELPVRVTRPDAVRLREVLGTPLCVATVFAGAVHLGVVITLARTWSPTVAVAYGVGVGVVGAASALAVGVVLHRPTLALDDSSLAVDERLRARDAAMALTTWFWVETALFGGLPHHPIGHASLLVFVGLLPPVGLTVAQLEENRSGRRWRL